MTEHIIICPHCDEPVIIEKLNCGIFRHGILKNTGKQMEPHSNKTICDELKHKDLIYGCGKPFQIIIDNSGQYLVTTCDYI